MDICEKIAYIKGLAEGLKLDDTKPEGKVLAAIIDLLGDITDEICDIEEGCEEIIEQIDAVDEDLADLEEYVYEDEYDDDDDDDCDCDCDCCDDEVYEIECPACNDVIYLDEEMLEEEGMVCPNCGTELEFDFEGCDCECCDCGEEETEE
ncbi:MAG: hypothetical protein E7537_01390 [Ruminococcaceae bacterium]|nr:hypothetical protein [Oscillospiraceae bacterium]